MRMMVQYAQALDALFCIKIMIYIRPTMNV